MTDYTFISITKSNKSDKKYMAKFKNKTTGREKTTHFGAAGYKDYTIYTSQDSKDIADKKKASYISRHKVNENWNDPIKAGTLSRYILWNKPTIAASIKSYKNMFF